MCRHQVTVYSERLDRDSNLYVTIKPKMKVTEYIREDGSSPYEKWFNSLDVQAAAKVTVALSRARIR